MATLKRQNKTLKIPEFILYVFVLNRWQLNETHLSHFFFHHKIDKSTKVYGMGRQLDIKQEIK